MTQTGFQPRDRLGIARRIAQDIPEGWFVNLGIGMPTTVSDYVPAEREVIFHAENGVIGIGPAPAPEDVNPYLVNAGVQPVTMRVGAALVHHADSFAIARGGHLDLCVLGAFQVAENGDLANWAHDPSEATRQIGGAIDLAVGAKRVWIAMEHTTRQGHARLLERCLYPLTAAGVVKRVYTDLAVLDVTPGGFVVREMVPGLDFETLQAKTGAQLGRA